MKNGSDETQLGPVGFQCWHVEGEHAGALEHHECLLLLLQQDGTRREERATSILLQSSSMNCPGSGMGGVWILQSPIVS